MNIGKTLLICSLVSLLCSCHLFQTTPQSVIEGQRAVYQGVLLAEQNDNKIIDQYISHTKASVTYHINFLFEPQIHMIRINPDLSRSEKSAEITIIEQMRQAKLDEAFTNIERIAGEMRMQAMQNHAITKRLIESVYNYLSTSPIEIDNIPFWIKKLEQASGAN